TIGHNFRLLRVLGRNSICLPFLAALPRVPSTTFPVLRLIGSLRTTDDRINPLFGISSAAAKNLKACPRTTLLRVSMPSLIFVRRPRHPQQVQPCWFSTCVFRGASPIRTPHR